MGLERQPDKTLHFFFHDFLVCPFCPRSGGAMNRIYGQPLRAVLATREFVTAHASVPFRVSTGGGNSSHAGARSQEINHPRPVVFTSPSSVKIARQTAMPRNSKPYVMPKPAAVYPQALAALSCVDQSTPARSGYQPTLTSIDRAGHEIYTYSNFLRAGTLLAEKLVCGDPYRSCGPSGSRPKT